MLSDISQVFAETVLSWFWLFVYKYHLKAVTFFFFPNSIKDKNKGELIPPVMKETVSYLKRNGEFCVKRQYVFQNKDNSMKL